MQVAQHIAGESPRLQPVGAFASDVLAGLSRNPKSIPSMYFYDTAGSRLFQQITELDEYYPTRCEREILEAHAAQLGDTVSDVPFRLVELGAGDGGKTAILLRSFLAAGLQFEYVPIDICRQSILELTATMRRRFDGAALHVQGITAEYSEGLAMLDHEHGRRNLVLFLGSNIGNFSCGESRQFLRRLRNVLGPGDLVLIGFDLKKDLDILHRAYNDSRGVTREFNLNLLDRVNRELGGRFDRRQFTHFGTYNPRDDCMESWLVSQRHQEVPIRALGRTFTFQAWEGIHVERSHKYDAAQIESLASATGFRVRTSFFDRHHWFADSLWEVDGDA